MTKQCLMIAIVMLFVTACSSTTNNAKPKQNNVVDLTSAMNALLVNCQTGEQTITLDDSSLNTFIRAFCETNSTTKQLKLIAEIKASTSWPNDFQIWFESLAWHTENLRQQKVTNYYSDSKAQQHQKQLLHVQKQLLELKQKLVDIEKQRLATEVSENLPQ